VTPGATPRRGQVHGPRDPFIPGSRSRLFPLQLMFASLRTVLRRPNQRDGRPSGQSSHDPKGTRLRVTEGKTRTCGAQNKPPWPAVRSPEHLGILGEFRSKKSVPDRVVGRVGDARVGCGPAACPQSLLLIRPVRGRLRSRGGAPELWNDRIRRGSTVRRGYAPNLEVECGKERA